MRYVGFPELVKTLVDMGFLDESVSDTWKSSISWREATKTLLGASASDDETLASAIDGKATFKDAEQRKTILAGLRWIGVLSDEKTTPRNNPLDTLCASLEQKMQYEDGERDMVLLQHKFGIELADGTKQVRTSTLCEYGSTEPGGYMAMAKLGRSRPRSFFPGYLNSCKDSWCSLCCSRQAGPGRYPLREGYLGPDEQQDQRPAYQGASRGQSTGTMLSIMFMRS